jgi:16S rRNA (guanine527-N7)-methyltransferase
MSRKRRGGDPPDMQANPGAPANEPGTNLLPPIEGPDDFAAAFAVPCETVEKLQTYAALLTRWQKVVNLVAPSSLSQMWHRHFADSAQILALAPDARCWIDLGSGAGFPGLVIAILLANHEDRIVHLVESNSRKCAFLSEVIRRTKVPAVVHAARIEDVAREGRIGTADVVTSRALAPLRTLLGLSCGFFGENTLGLFLKGREARQEIEEAGKRWRFEHRCIPSRTSGEGRIIEIRKLIS